MEHKDHKMNNLEFNIQKRNPPRKQDTICYATSENSHYTEIQIYILNRYLACWKKSASWPAIIKDIASEKYNLCSLNERSGNWMKLENLISKI